MADADAPVYRYCVHGRLQAPAGRAAHPACPRVMLARAEPAKSRLGRASSMEQADAVDRHPGRSLAAAGLAGTADCCATRRTEVGRRSSALVQAHCPTAVPRVRVGPRRCPAAIAVRTPSWPDAVDDGLACGRQPARGWQWHPRCHRVAIRLCELPRPARGAAAGCVGARRGARTARSDRACAATGRPSSCGVRWSGRRCADSHQQLERSETLQRALFAISDLAGSERDMPSMLRGIHAIVSTLMYAENFFIVLLRRRSATRSAFSISSTCSIRSHRATKATCR